MRTDPQPKMPRPPLGALTVICGPMFTGKTTALIDRLEDAQRRTGASFAAIKPALDNRYHATDLVTHNGRTFEARTIDEPRELLALSEGVIGLDEAHFFAEGLHAAVLALVERGALVIVAGLARTSMNEPFGEMGRLLIEADEVVKLAGRCAICERPAVHTIRLFDSTEPIVVGGPGMFENRCRAHLHPPHPHADKS